MYILLKRFIFCFTASIKPHLPSQCLLSHRLIYFNSRSRTLLYGHEWENSDPNIILGNSSIQATIAIANPKFLNPLNFAKFYPSDASATIIHGHTYTLLWNTKLVFLGDQNISSFHSFPPLFPLYPFFGIFRICSCHLLHHSSPDFTCLSKKKSWWITISGLSLVPITPMPHCPWSTWVQLLTTHLPVSYQGCHSIMQNIFYKLMGNKPVWTLSVSLHLLNIFSVTPLPVAHRIIIILLTCSPFCVAHDPFLFLEN